MNTVDPTTVLPGLRLALNDLTKRFGTRIEAIKVARPNEVYFEARMELVPVPTRAPPPQAPGYLPRKSRTRP